jgi:hypothetical protein
MAGWHYNIHAIVGKNYAVKLRERRHNKANSSVITNQDLVELKSANIILRNPTVKPKINQQTAMQNAQMFSDQAISKNPALKNGMINIPAYIVTFIGGGLTRSKGGGEK